jgi:hypothetical protein
MRIEADYGTALHIMQLIMCLILLATRIATIGARKFSIFFLLLNIIMSVTQSND